MQNLFRLLTFAIILAGLFFAFSCSPINTSSSNNNNNPSQNWVARQDTISGLYAYYASNGQKTTQDYPMVFTDTFKQYAFVFEKDMVLIDRKGKIQHKVLIFDNGPDMAQEGLYRIIGEDGKIGFADAIMHQIVIQPQYECAYPFEGGIAKVANQCTRTKEGDYMHWDSNQWYYIDKKGQKIKN